jgi:hypothetical protein
MPNHSARRSGLQIKNPQSALLSNHEVYLHIQQEEAEYSGADGTGRARTKPKGFKNVLKDVCIPPFRNFIHVLWTSGHRT